MIRTEFPADLATGIVYAILDSMVDALRDEDTIRIKYFGTFCIRRRKPRIGRNPQTAEKVPAKRIVFFKPSEELKQLGESSQLTS